MYVTGNAIKMRERDATSVKIAVLLMRCEEDSARVGTECMSKALSHLSRRCVNLFNQRVACSMNTARVANDR